MAADMTLKQAHEDIKRLKDRVRELEGDLLKITRTIQLLDNTIAGYRLDILKATNALSVSRQANDILIALLAEAKGISIEEITGLKNAN